MSTVLITDFAWPDLDVEHGVLDPAGIRLVAGPARAAPAEVIDDLAATHQPQAIMTNWATVSARAIAACPDLRLVARIGVGLDNIAVDEATRRGAWVTNVPDYCVEEVSDHAIGLLLAWARGIVSFDGEVKCGRWDPASARLHRVSTLTVGIVGYGRIGRMTARKLHGFGVRLLAFDAYAASDDVVEMVELDTLLAASDVIVLHVPLTSDTHHLMNAARLTRVKRGAFLINVSRGAVIDTGALVEALRDGRLSGAGLDVLESEPDVPTALRENRNVIITPHVAFSSSSSLAELRRRVCEEVVRVLSGERPQHACNMPAGRAMSTA
jgi:D-3-phosphoglycerate dehydrogenase